MPRDTELRSRALIAGKLESTPIWAGIQPIAGGAGAYQRGASTQEQEASIAVGHQRISLQDAFLARDIDAKPRDEADRPTMALRLLLFGGLSLSLA